MTVVMGINDWANRCGFFYNAYLEPADPNDKNFYPGRNPSPNNGYNCRHPEAYHADDGTGCCYTWSCPFGFEADEEDCEAFGLEYEDSEFIVLDIPEKDYTEKCMWKKKEASQR
jgi:hypothetical protein